jgi:hypothetical protein
MNFSLHNHQPSTRWVMLLVAYLTAVQCKCQGTYLPKYKADHLPLSTKVENECWIFPVPLWHGAYTQNVSSNKTLSQSIYYLHSPSCHHQCLFTDCTLHPWQSTY